MLHLAHLPASQGQPLAGFLCAQIIQVDVQGPAQGDHFIGWQAPLARKRFGNCINRNAGFFGKKRVGRSTFIHDGLQFFSYTQYAHPLDFFVSQVTILIYSSFWRMSRGFAKIFLQIAEKYS